MATMGSGAAGYGRIDFADLQWTSRNYSASRSYAQSKLADMIMTRELARIADERGWPLLSTGAHPGYTRTNLQTAGASLGNGRRSLGTTLLTKLDFLPSQGAEQGAEPLLYAATSPDAVAGGYYGPGGRFGLVGPTTTARMPRKAFDTAVNARLWAEAERLTGVALPVHAV
ncbi:hypothetical protein [Streptomyces camponoticapitis]|nr:hypothetical protein [Streptomyces camponoticapitis]